MQKWQIHSKSGKHKLANFYYTLLDMPAHYLSSVDNIILLCSLKQQDLKLSSANSVLQVVVNELQDLWVNGIDFCQNGVQRNVKIALAQISGDNLGLHSILGFSEGFTANYPCRRCKMHKLQCQTEVFSLEENNRSLENYDVDVRVSNLSTTGINFETVINKLPYHHVTKMFVFDIMHDLFEGVVPDFVFLLVNHCIGKGYFNLDTFNYRVESFNYGKHFASSKPSQFKPSFLKGDTKSGQNASQNMSLIFFLPLLINDLVLESDLVWPMLGLLREIIDLVLSPSISRGGLNSLRMVIAEYCTKYQEIFKRKLKPKHHHLLHYADSIMQIGPLKQYWSMAFESRHKFFKITSHTTCNYQNLPKTVTYRHQVLKCFKLLSKDVFTEWTFDVPNYEFVKISKLKYSDEIGHRFLLDPSSKLKISSKIISNGCEYRVGCFILLKYCNLYPEFGLIEHIVLENEECNFVITKFESEFLENFHCYKICSLNTVEILELSQLVYYQPLYSYESFKFNDLNKYIILPIKFM